MKTRSSALYRRTVRYHHARSGWLSAAVAVIFASLPLGILLLVLPAGLA